MYEPEILRDRSAYVLGGTSGINLGLAKTLARYGARVCVIGRDAAKAERAASEIAADSGGEAIYVTVDVRDYEGVETSMHQAVRHFGPLDIVVAGAAGNFFAPAVSISAKGFRTVIDIDLLGTYHVLQRACARASNGMGASRRSSERNLARSHRGHRGTAAACTDGGGTGRSPRPRRASPFWNPRRHRQRRDLPLLSPRRIVTGTILDVDGGFQLGDASADCLIPTR